MLGLFKNRLFVETDLAGRHNTALKRPAACKNRLVRHIENTCGAYLPGKERKEKQNLVGYTENLDAEQFLESLKDLRTILNYDMNLLPITNSKLTEPNKQTFKNTKS